MDLKDYKKFHKMIINNEMNNSYAAYLRMMEVFVQDCFFPVHQKFFGNLTKEKARVLMDLQRRFLS